MELRKILLSLILAISIVFTYQSNYNTNNIVYAKAVTKVKINKKYATLSIGETVKLKITGTKKKVTWKSSNKKIATVTSKGKVKGIKEGMTTIIAKVDKKKYTCTVIVEDEYEKIPVEEVSDNENVGVYMPICPTPTIPHQTPIVYTTSTPNISQDLYYTSIKKVNQVLSEIPATVPPKSVVTSTNSPIETVESTPQATIEPTSTEILSTNIYQENYKKLEEYMVVNGNMNNNGTISISNYWNCVCYTIEYCPMNLSYRFMLYYSVGIAANGIILYIDKNNIDECKVEFGIKDSFARYAYLSTTSELRNIYMGSNLNWDVLSITSENDIWKSDAKSWLTIGVGGWDTILSEQLNMNTTDLGFGTGTTEPTNTTQ